MAPYDRTYWKGVLLNERTRNMMEAAEKRSGVECRAIQGSYNSGGVSASAGTHDGGGALDCWPVSGTQDDARKLIHGMRSVGFAAWIRDPSQGPWSFHIHGIAIGDKQMSSGARQQVSEYYNGYDGLAGYGRDYHWRPDPIPVWDGADKKRLIVDRSRVASVIRRASGGRPRWMVRRVQRALRKAGYQVAVDGFAGLQTRGAFRAYRRKHDVGPIRAVYRLGRLGGFRTKL